MSHRAQRRQNGLGVALAEATDTQPGQSLTHQAAETVRVPGGGQVAECYVIAEVVAADAKT